LNKNISEILKFFAQLAKKPSAFSNQNSKFKEFIMSEEEEKKTTDGREFFFKILIGIHVVNAYGLFACYSNFA